MKTWFQRTHTEEAGFTLVELLVVILIIGILAAVAIPVFLNQRQKASQAAVVSDLKNAGMLLEGQGKFTGTLPEDMVTSKGVTLSAMRTSDRNNQIGASQFVDGKDNRWSSYIAAATPGSLATKVVTDAKDGYQGMNYRQVTVSSVKTGSTATMGQNVSVPLTLTGQKGETYTVGIAMRHNYTGCREINIEYKDNSTGRWPGGIFTKQVCFTKDEWNYFESSGTMKAEGSDIIFLSLYGPMALGNTFETTGAVIVKGATIRSIK